MQNNRMRSSNEAKGIIPEPEIGGLRQGAAYTETQMPSRETKAKDNNNIKNIRENSSL